MTVKPTLVIGASSDPTRYSYKAIELLQSQHHPVYALGKTNGKIGKTVIVTDRPLIEDINTITLYIRPELQAQYTDYILQTKPQRLIFNPGTENSNLMAQAQENGIECIEACTLVMLNLGIY